MTTIRAVTSADVQPLIALWREVFPEYGDLTRPQRDPRANILRKLAFDDLFWLAVEEQTIVGSVMAGYDGHRGWIYSLGVHPQARGRGIGRALVAHAETALAARGCPKINLQVLADKAGAQRFWQRVGYAPDPVVSLGRRLVT